MKNFKRTMAALVAMTMTMSTAGVIASAEDVTGVTGGGKVEDIIDIEIFDIDLPTIPADNAKVFDFILDPQLLIGATNGDALGTFDVLDDTATLLFKNVIGAEVNWSNESDSLTAYNRSNAPVNLEVKATVTDAEGITFVSGYKKDEDGKEVKDDNGDHIVATPEEDKAQIKLSFIGGDDGDEFEFVQAEDGTISATLTAEIAEIDDSNFTTKYTAGASGAKGTYEHVLKDDFDLSTTPSYSFKLVGEASKNINGKAWTSLKSKAPKLAVTWKITDTRTVSGEPTVPETVAGNATSLKIDVEMGNATEIKSIEHMMGSATTWTAFPSPSNGVPYAFADGKITFGANQSKALSTKGAKLRITFDDGSTTGVQKVVTVQKIS